MVSVPWVQFMFNKHRNLEQILFPVMLAAGALLVAGYLVVYEQLSVLKGVGVIDHRLPKPKRASRHVR